MSSPTHRFRRASAVASLAALAGLGPACGTEPDAPDRAAARAPLNVVLITLDTTRADALGCYGQPLPASPHLDRLAAEGLRFDQVVTSAPSTLPSHATILTGKQPYAHGARSNSGYVLSETNLTLAEVLRRHGYATGAEIAAQVIGSRTQLDQGFDHYRDLDAFDVLRKSVPLMTPTGLESVELPERGAEDITRRGLEFLRAHREGPFFLWLHYFDPHWAYAAPPVFAERLPRSPYHAEILYADYHVSRIAAEIVRLGLRERTLVVVTSDHGEGLGEHDESTHAYFVWDSTMRVPLILWGADVVPTGRVVTPLVRTVDIAPTILDLLDLPPLEGVQGVSLRPLIEGTEADLGLTGYGESLETLKTFGTAILRFVREGDWKYVHKVSPQLFDVRKDPRELDDRASAHPETLARLQSRLRELIAAAPLRPEDAEVPLDAETLEQLAALGYVGASPAPKLGDELAELALRGPDPALLTDEIQAVAEAYGHLKSKHYERAAASFRALRAAHPESPALIFGLILALNHLERDEEAIPLLRRGIELDPGFRDFYVILAALLEDRGDVEEAEGLLRTAMELDPCGLHPRVRLSNLLAGEGRYDDQLDLLRSSIDTCRDPNRTAFRNEYAYALATARDDRVRNGAEALRIATEVVDADGAAHPSFLDTLAAAYAEVGDFGQAVETSRRAIALLRNREVSDDVIESFERNLAEYEAGRPVREP
ncbi:MAG: sulfatase-like hydrolase/transferase [Myxococcales bacterium]|nr:sulfatase-like hydrolase/transferase [Myxococcales bacterium]